MAYREQIIEALAFPRKLVQDSLDLHQCPHGGFFSPAETGCQDCDDRAECQWLYHYDEFAAMENKPVAVLVDALDFALTYVRAQVATWEHDSQGCRCDACRWLRASEKLYDVAGL
jgi:hypothetical protein